MAVVESDCGGRIARMCGSGYVRVGFVPSMGPACYRSITIPVYAGFPFLTPLPPKEQVDRSFRGSAVSEVRQLS